MPISSTSAWPASAFRGVRSSCDRRNGFLLSSLGSRTHADLLSRSAGPDEGSALVYGLQYDAAAQGSAAAGIRIGTAIDDYLLNTSAVVWTPSRSIVESVIVPRVTVPVRESP